MSIILDNVHYPGQLHMWGMRASIRALSRKLDTVQDRGQLLF